MTASLYLTPREILIKEPTNRRI